MGEEGELRLTIGEARALRGHCQHFSQLGWALFTQAASALAVQAAAVAAVRLLAPGILEEPVFLWLLSTLSVYGVGFPLFCLVIRRSPAPPAAQTRRPLGPARFFQVYLIGLAALYLFNFITLLLMEAAGWLRGAPVDNPVDNIQSYPDALNLLLGCVIAPAAEEWMFRGLLLSRLRPYGDKFAILSSALCFGLFHGNVNQLLYAFALGTVFAYVVVRTGCLWQTIALHAMVNLIATGLVPLLEGLGERGEQLLGTLMLGVVMLGVVFFAAIRRELRFDRGSSGLTEGRKWRLFFENPGVLFFCLLAAVEAASYFILL